MIEKIFDKNKKEVWFFKGWHKVGSGLRMISWKDRGEKFFAEDGAEIHPYDKAFSHNGISEIYPYKNIGEIYNRLKDGDSFNINDILVPIGSKKMVSKGKLVIDAYKSFCIATTIEHTGDDAIRIYHFDQPSQQFGRNEYYLGPETIRRDALRKIDEYPENIVMHKKYKEILTRTGLWGDIK